MNFTSVFFFFKGIENLTYTSGHEGVTGKNATEWKHTVAKFLHCTWNDVMPFEGRV